VNHVSTFPHADIDVFAGHRSVNDASDNDSWKRESERDLATRFTCRAERRRTDKWTGKVVYDNRDCGVEGYGNTLLYKQGFFEITRIFELCLEGEESNVAGWLWSVFTKMCEMLICVLYANMMFMTGPIPLIRGRSGRTATTLPASGLSIPIAIMATVTAEIIDKQAELYQ
jgi:hypothetical protein